MVLKPRHSAPATAAAAYNSMLGFLIRNRKDVNGGGGGGARDVNDDDDDGNCKNKSKNNNNNKTAAAVVVAAASDIRPVKRQRVADPIETLSSRYSLSRPDSHPDSYSGFANKICEADVSRAGPDGLSPGRRRRKQQQQQQQQQVKKEEGREPLRHEEVRGLAVGSESIFRGDGEEDDDDDGGVSRGGQGENEEEKERDGQKRATDLESAMPSFAESEDVAMKEYEAFRASQQQEEEEEEEAKEEQRNVGVAEVQESASLVGITMQLPNGENKRRETTKSKNQWIKGRSSIYVDAFKLALETVLDEEAHLFDERERSIFTAWKELSYEAQYLYVRLFLRKTAAWHRISGLGYNGDISDLESAIKELQIERELPEAAPESQDYMPFIEPLDESITPVSSLTFADTSSGAITSLEEASSLLRLGELKTFAKDAKVRGKNKAELLKALRRTSKKQSGLGWASLKRSDTESSAGGGTGNVSEADSVTAAEETPESPAELGGPGMNLDAHLVQQMLAETGPCIRLSLPVLKLFERVHLVFYRSTEWTEKSLTTIILAGISRRKFPSYIVSRSANIFPSRMALREFEAALRAQGKVDNILEFSGRPTPAGLDEIFEIFEAVLPRWRVLLCEEQVRENSVYLSGEGAYLRRLSPAWVYTRIIHKATSILAKRKDYLREHAILTELLDQNLFHTSRRGAWYIRKALLEEHYMAKETLLGNSQPSAPQIRDWKRKSLVTCETGLQDPLVHLIYHHDLQKRIAKLERALCVPKRQQHSFAHVRLAKATETTVHGIRLEAVQASTSSLPQPPRRRPSQSSGTTTATTAATAQETDDARPRAASTTNSIGNSSRTIWLDPRDNISRYTVEEMVLTHYRLRGWSGFHSESGIVRTLFALLLFDEIFTYVPHVFQTAFQNAPLDLLHSDSFYAARRPALEAALADIANGGAAARIRAVWSAHAHQRTCVIGLDWSAFTLEQLIDIIECAGGPALAVVCKVLAQEYAQRAGGVPDLLLWRRDPRIEEQLSNKGSRSIDNGHQESTQGQIRFVEVKSENDRLSDTQRLWIDVLTGAGVAVELCHAVAEEIRILD